MRKFDRFYTRVAVFHKLSLFVREEPCSIWLHLLCEKRLEFNSVLLWKQLMILQNVLWSSYGDKLLGFWSISVTTQFYAWSSSVIVFLYSCGSGSRVLTKLSYVVELQNIVDFSEILVNLRGLVFHTAER